MREIKFRAWLGDRGIYIINGFQKHLNGITIYPLDSLGNKIDDWYRMDKETTELMQYTGLKDKNGVEIYEGDIIKERIGSYWQIDPRVVESVWDLHVEMNHDDSYYRVVEVEVIGNIYENPELLP